MPHSSRTPSPLRQGSEVGYGDFTTRKVLADQGRRAAVIDLEGFGRGTRGIDLVALIASMIGHASANAFAPVKDRPLAASDPSTFRACLVHRRWRV